MSLNLSDPAIQQAYQGLLHPPPPEQQQQDESIAVHDFILLEYDPNPTSNSTFSPNPSSTNFRSSLQTQQALRLAALGTNGLQQLKPLFKPGEVLFALIRIQRKILIIQYFSEDISGVKRARALVHGRAVCNMFSAASANVVIARQEDLTEFLIRSSLKLDRSLPITSEAERERERQERLSVAWPTPSSQRNSLNGGSPDPDSRSPAGTLKATTPLMDSKEANSPFKDTNASSPSGSSILNASPAGYSSSRPRIQGLGLGLNLNSSPKMENDRSQEGAGGRVAAARNGSNSSFNDVSQWSSTTSSSPGADQDVTASIMKRNLAVNPQPSGLAAASNLPSTPSSFSVTTPLASTSNAVQSKLKPITPNSSRSRSNSFAGPPGPPPIGIPLPALPGEAGSAGPPDVPLPPLPKTPNPQLRSNKAIPPPPPADEYEAARLEKEKEEFLAFQRNEAIRSEALDREKRKRKERELVKKDEAKREEVMRKLQEEQEKGNSSRSTKASKSGKLVAAEKDRDRTYSGPAPATNGHSKGASDQGMRPRTLSHQVGRGASESISRVASPSHTSPPPASSPRPGKPLEEEYGESWLSRHTKKQSEERVLAGSTYSKVLPREKDLPTSPHVPGSKRVGSGGGGATSSMDRAEQIALSQIERARAEQRSLEFQLSEVERRNRERNEAEAAARARWARQQAERERLDAFERSKLESAERLRREAVEKRNREEAHSAEETRKEKEKKALEEKEAILMAQRRRKDAEEREQRLKAEVARRKEREEEVRLREEKKRSQRQSLMKKFESRTYDDTVVLSGNVTVQKSDATIWRRRFYELRGSDLRLSKSESEKSTILDTIQLRGLVRSLEDNPEDSQMLNSFQLGFVNTGSSELETIILATDSHEEKESLLCAIGVLSKAQN